MKFLIFWEKGLLGRFSKSLITKGKKLSPLRLLGMNLNFVLKRKSRSKFSSMLSWKIHGERPTSFISSTLSFSEGIHAWFLSFSTRTSMNFWESSILQEFQWNWSSDLESKFYRVSPFLEDIESSIVTWNLRIFCSNKKIKRELKSLILAVVATSTNKSILTFKVGFIEPLKWSLEFPIALLLICGLLAAFWWNSILAILFSQVKINSNKWQCSCNS